MKIDILNIQGGKTGRSIDLPDEIFGVDANQHVVYLDVKQHLANKRQGTHKSKERGEVKGSTKKIKKQKGTGTARFGDIKNPLFRGGGRVFGPRPRKYNLRQNKKVKSLARKSALSAKASSGNLMVIEDFTFDAPKTKEFNGIINSLELNNKKMLLVTGEHDKIVYLSGRNIQGANIKSATELNTYDIMKANSVVLSESSVGKLIEQFSK